MPLYKKIKPKEGLIIAVWEINESEKELLNYAEEPAAKFAHIKAKSQRLQRIAVYALMKELGVDSKMRYKGRQPILSEGHISISHTKNFAVVALSDKHPVGVDIELPSDRIGRIKDKFLNEQEKSQMQQPFTDEELCVYWSIKECLFKFYGKGDVIFKEDLLVKPFKLNNEKGTANALLNIEDCKGKVELCYQKIENYLLVFTTSDLIYP